MTKPAQRQAILTIRASLFGLALSLCGFSAAQQNDLQFSVEEASSALQTLDDKASACLSAREKINDDQASCNDFLAAVDGELMANYLRHCTDLKSWRDDFVTQTTAANVTLENSEEMLQLLVAVEFNCGQNALQRRTQSVASAFALLQGSTSAQFDGELRRRLAEMEFDATDSRERQALQNSVQQQQARTQFEVQRQTDALENEIIRQQIRNPKPLN